MCRRVRGTPALAIAMSMREDLLQRQAHRFLDRRKVGDVAVQRQTTVPRESHRNRLRPG